MANLPPGFVLDPPNSQRAVPYGPPPVVDPLKVRDQQIQESGEQRAAAQEQRDILEWNATHNPDGTEKPKPAAADSDAAGKIAAMDSVVQQINHVQGLYNRGLRDETISNLFGAGDLINTPGNAAFDSAGAALGDQGMAAFRVPGQGPQSDQDAARFVAANQPAASDWDARIEEKLDSLRRRIDANRQALGLPPVEWQGVGAAQTPSPVAGAAPPGAPPAGGPDAPLRPWSPQDPSYTANGQTRTVDDPQMAAIAGEYRSRLAAGQGAGEIIPWLRSQGVSPQTLMQAVQQIQYRRANPNVPIESYTITSSREVPLSLYEQGATAAGNVELPGGFSPGAYAIGAGQFLSGNTLDNLSGDPERARLAEQVMAANNPGSTVTGQITGGILSGLVGEAGLARLGMSGGLMRGAAADTLAGAANGAGMADDGSRLAGAAQGGVSQGLGSLVGGGAMRVAGRALNPTGGRLADLYAEGVRPTPGQRVAGANGGKGLAGMAGGAINAVEEAVQSVPLVGSAIRGAREGARDQFQLGGFNQALREIGEELPAGTQPGTAPHKFVTESFGRVYDQARSGMRLVADEELGNDLSGVVERVTLLAEPSANRFHTILRNVVQRRVRNGELEGEGYKKAQSELGKVIASIRNSKTGDDELADALTDLSHALDVGARRHSPPEAVALLDAADRGWAKYVRIKEAARRRGGEAGTFGPNDLDAAVQRESSGPRSEQYLRGEALMQDYAKQGMSLRDRLPNSGTADRVMAGYAVGSPVAAGAVWAEPATASVLASIGLAYAPGVRRVTTGVLAPSKGKRRAIAAALRRIERVGGAATGAAALLGTSPAP